MLRKKSLDHRITTAQTRLNQWLNITTLRTLKQVQALMVVSAGFISNPSAVRELIFTCAIAIPGGMSYAHRLFDHIPKPDTFTWNTMIRGSAQSGEPSKAVSLYSRMDRSSVARPDQFTFPCVLKACTRLCWVNVGSGIHAKVVKFGFDGNKFVRNTLIYFHANCGDIAIARELFNESDKEDVVTWSALTAGYARRGELDVARQLYDEMPVKDIVAMNVMITGYAKNGRMVDARKLFDQLPRRDLVTWNAMISGYVQSGCQEEGLRLYEQMRCLGEHPDEVTMLSLLSACADLGNMDMGKQIHHAVVEMHPKEINILLGNALIDMYAKCGSIETALEVFRGMRERDVSTWNSILGGLAFHGHSEESLLLFADMQRLKFIRPNEITFVAVLVACSHAGKVKEGCYYFDLMVEKYGIASNMRHHGCMVDMFSRSGQLDKAFDYIAKMKGEPNAIIWRTLLAACRVHGNVQLASHANKQLMRLRKGESGDYVLLSNVYASIEKWDGVEKVRNLMDHGGVRKESGGASLVEEHDRSMMDFLFDSGSKRRGDGSFSQ